MNKLLIRKTATGALIGLAIGVVIAFLLKFITASNVFGDHIFGALSTGDALLIMGVLIGGMIAYFSGKPVVK